MAEQGQNNLPANNESRADEFDDEFIPEGARPLCPKCLKPCHPLQHYCNNCDSNDAINPLTPYMAFLNIRFNYGIFCTMWRKLWYDKHTSVICKLFFLFLIIVFAPIMFIVALPFFLIGKGPQLQETSTVVFFVIAIILSMIFLFFLFSGLPVSAPLIH